MVESLLRVFAVEGLDGALLVVVDSSPDGTGAIAEQLAARYSAVHVLHRRGKNGLGRAYVEGFNAALGAGAELIAQMDCDFSHDPADLPRLVDACNDADIVLGSRYVHGGRVENWSLARRVLSRLGSAYARLILGVRVHDLTGGYKCFRRDALHTLGLDSLEASGFGFQIETTYRAHRHGLRIREIPITFRDRTAGRSKMSTRIALEALQLVPRLRFAQAATIPYQPNRNRSAAASALTD
jgi:dolichol-phosphate mannosyltransferase